MGENKQLPAKSQSKTITQKKMKVEGVQTYLNVNTGELEEMVVSRIEERDFNFAKVWMKDWIRKLDNITNQKTKVAYHMVDNLNAENEYIGTIRKLATDCNVSIETARETLKQLQLSDFMRKKQNGVYKVNAEVFFDGTHKKRLGVVTQYQQLGVKIATPTTQEKINNLTATIAALQKELDKLITPQADIEVEIEGQLSYAKDGSIVQKAKEIK